MENRGRTRAQLDAEAALVEAEAARTAMANRVEVPAFFFTILGAAVALQIAASAVGLATADDLGIVVLVVGNLLFLAVCGVELWRFRRLNGLWLGGLANRVVGGTASAAATSYVIAFGAALWAAFADVWWLVPICAAAGGVGYALSGSAWLRKYYSAPAVHGPGGSVVWLGVAVVLSVAGLVLLVASR